MDSMNDSKTKRLLGHLRDLANLRTKTIRDMSDYQETLWFSDVLNISPTDKNCFFIARGTLEEDSDAWLEIKNRKKPEKPPIPRQCEEWVDEKTLLGTDEPKLLPEIKDSQCTSKVTSKELCEYPDVIRQWNSYINDRWHPWQEEYNAWKSLNDIYLNIYKIYMEQSKQGEAYELLLGFGLLVWKTENDSEDASAKKSYTVEIRRHIIVANALLEFDSKKEKFTVKTHPDGAKTRTNLDMLSGLPHAPIGVADQIEEEARENPWKKQIVEGTLKSIVHLISSQGKYLDTFDKVATATQDPVIRYAPALVLRKRTAKGFIDAVDKTIKAVENGEKVSPEFAALAEIQGNNSDGHNSYQEATGCTGKHQEDNEIYFPKPYNEIQRQIIEKNRKTNGLLVQGPPGTGKSHTIANVICHLLATGQRILITAHTQRALQVLEGLLPEELRPLCINLLGSGLEEKKSLESSVKRIVDKHSNWNEQQEAERLKREEKRLNKLREERAHLEQQSRDSRESETRKYSLPTLGEYQGTLSQIIQAVNADEESLGWFEDIVANDAPEIYPLNILLSYFRLTGIKIAELKREIPTELPSPDEVGELFINEKNKINAIASLRRTDTDAAIEITSLLSENTVDTDDIKNICLCLEELATDQKQLMGSKYGWVKKVIADISHQSVRVWHHLRKTTSDCVEELGSDAFFWDRAIIEPPEPLSNKVLLSSAEQLIAHLENGGELTGIFGLFPNKIAKEHASLLNTRLNGQACNNYVQIANLARCLSARCQLDEILEDWKEYSGKIPGSPRLQLQEIQNLLAALDSTLAIEGPMEKARIALQKIHSSIQRPDLHDIDQLEIFMETCKLADLLVQKNKMSSRIQAIVDEGERVLKRQNPHPLVGEMIKAIEGRNEAEYRLCYNQLNILIQQRESLNRFIGYRDEMLRKHYPKLTLALEATASEPYWDARPDFLSKAVCRCRAKKFVEQHRDKDSIQDFMIRIKQIEEEIGDTLSRMASGRAWSEFFARFSDNHRKHMEEWQRAMKKLGKGTGKYAEKNRRDAQEELDQCREAIPAWIMPLYRVWDTVSPSPGIFDVVIVDEASQCNYEALLLMYLGKKIIIVGDDKQISPESIGIQTDQVLQLIDKNLPDFAFKNAFDCETSLFDHGRRMYANNLTLREHFRCMPEIIAFSNDLCYSATPLIPLRQHGMDRLKPLASFLVSGYVKGVGSNVTNLTEADAIVEKIMEICNDQTYKGKSIGVITLQGNAQAGLIEGKLLEKLDATEMQDRRILCGNPNSFQGDERDIILLSMVASLTGENGTRTIGSLTKSTDERRFNVAASRARDQMLLFHSVVCADLNVDCLRHKLLNFFEEGAYIKKVAGIDRETLEKIVWDTKNRGIIKAPQPFDSWFEVDVALELLRRGFSITPQVEVVGKRMSSISENVIKNGFNSSVKMSLVQSRLCSIL